MTVVHLADRALLGVFGADAETFLQNIVTVDLAALGYGEARPGALLSPQGKILFDFLISRHGADGFRLECRREAANDFARRLTLYRLRAKAAIEVLPQVLVAVSWGEESGPSRSDSPSSRSDSPSSRNDSSSSRSESSVVDRRFLAPPTVSRHYDEVPPASAGPDAWLRLKIAAGIAESGTDYAAGEAFPHDVLLDQMSGVDFRKGCYVGQEVVSRMQHRGTARRRVLIAAGSRALPATGTAITAAGRVVGELGAVSGDAGLAIARIDRVGQAMEAGTPLLADGVTLRLTIPEWASFTFPETAPAADEP